MSRPIERCFVLAALLLLVLPVSVRAMAEEEPPARSALVVIEQLNGSLLEVMQQAETLGYQGRYDRLYSIMAESFDLPFMAEKSVGRYWKKLTDEERARWLQSFRQMTTATYAGRFEGYSGQSFEMIGEEPAKHDTVVVRTKLIDPGNEDVQLTYRLREGDRGWRIIDVFLNGTVSELALRRAEYAAVLKREGFEKLIENIDGKTQQLAQGSAN